MVVTAFAFKLVGFMDVFWFSGLDGSDRQCCFDLPGLSGRGIAGFCEIRPCGRGNLWRRADFNCERSERGWVFFVERKVSGASCFATLFVFSSYYPNLCGDFVFMAVTFLNLVGVPYRHKKSRA